jgi:hypothetical protein
VFAIIWNIMPPGVVPLKGLHGVTILYPQALRHAALTSKTSFYWETKASSSRSTFSCVRHMCNFPHTGLCYELQMFGTVQKFIDIKPNSHQTHAPSKRRQPGISNTSNIGFNTSHNHSVSTLSVQAEEKLQLVTYYKIFLGDIRWKAPYRERQTFQFN